jgi:RHS repeat-associated protein
MDEPDGAKVTYAYDAAGNLASVTDERNKTATYQYDAAHNLTETLDPDGHPLRSLTYSTDGRLKTVADGAGNVSTLTLDPNARTEIVTGPDPRLTTITSMNPRGDIVQIDQVFGGKTLTTTFHYDDFGHVLSKTDPLGHVTQATYDAAGSPLTLTEPDTGTWTFTYDDRENLTSVTDRTHQQIATLKYDSYGELTKKTTPDGDVIYTYGRSGLLASMTDTLGRTTTYGYDSAGHVTSVTGPDGRIWSYSYDANGKTKTVTDPASEITTFHYDDAGNLAWFKDALGHGQTYSYDDLGRLATATDALGQNTTYTYNAAGQVETTLDRNNATTRFAYDASGNVTGVTLPGGSVLTYTYDPLGRMTEADDADATLAFTYDDAGSLKSQTSGGTATSSQPTVALTFGRDTAGRPTSVIAPWGTTTYAYDANGLLKTVTDPSSGVFTFGYDPLGRLASLSRPNGVSDVYVYEPTGQLSSRTSSLGAAAIDALSYTYDDSGQVKTKTDSAGTTTYGYDNADRLISVLAPAGSALPNETFTYDAVGNQTQSGQTYDAANRLLSDAKFTYTYDGEGNETSRTERVSGKVTTYAWNALHQLTSAHLPDGTVVSYRYDALGNRVEQSSAAGTTRYVNLGANVIAEYDGSNTLRASYVTTIGTANLPGTLLETNLGGTATYPLLDGVGSVTGTTNASGVLTSFAYTVYGAPVGASSGTYAYGTYGYDSATGIYYARARYYDPGSGRFLTEDSSWAVESYEYGLDDPLHFSDPTGRDAMVEEGTEESIIDAAYTKAATGGEDSVFVQLYAGANDGQGYIGIAKDVASRTAGRFKAQVEIVLDLTRNQARVVETKAIEYFGDATHWSADTSLTNSIRSVGTDNLLYNLVNLEDLTFVDMGAVLGAIALFFEEQGVPY